MRQYSIFDRRVDAGEDADLWGRDSAARQSVEHSLNNEELFIRNPFLLFRQDYFYAVRVSQCQGVATDDIRE